MDGGPGELAAALLMLRKRGEKGEGKGREKSE